jgi:hypothetical protein
MNAYFASTVSTGNGVPTGHDSSQETPFWDISLKLLTSKRIFVNHKTKGI